MDTMLINYINNEILRRASKLSFLVKDFAPNTENELFSSTSLIVWSGASDKTLYNDPKVNYAFRALHDVLHLETQYSFNVESEIELGRIQASLFDSDIMRELIFAEVSLQAKHYGMTGEFVADQVTFNLKHLRNEGLIK